MNEDEAPHDCAVREVSVGEKNKLPKWIIW